MKLILRDRNPDLVQAWSAVFRGVAGVEVGCGDIFDVPADALVSPANSSGFMNGGIDMVYTRRFGWQLSDRLRAEIVREHDGDLPVGLAAVLRIRPEGEDEPGDGYTYLVAAPTMRVPADVRGTVNAYLAMRAALRAVRAFGSSIRTVLCPGMGTAIGMLPPTTAAIQMREAYRVVCESQPLQFSTIGEAAAYHEALRRGVPPV